MKRWPIKPLGEVAEFINGRAFKPSDWSTTGVPIIRIKNLTDPTAPANYYDGDFDERNAVKDGDLLVSWSATLDVFFWNRGNAILNQHIFRVAPDFSKVSKTYLFYALKSVMDELRSKTHGATMKHITKGPFEKTGILLPPLAEQERIVKLLDEADALRQLRTQSDHRSAQLLPALFHEMFGDPATSRSWPVERLENLCERVTVGYVGPMATEYCETGITFLRGQNIKRGYLDLSSVLFISGDFHRRIEKSSIAPGDVVSVRTGKPGTTAVIPPTLKIANCADLIVMTCGPRLNPIFLCELLNQRLGDQEKLAGTTGIAQLHFNIGAARKLEISVPPLPLQKEFAQRVKEIRELEAAQAASRRRTEDLFQSLLHQAFTGEI